MIKVTGVKKNGVWRIKAEKNGIKCDVDGVISIKSYIHIIPNFLKDNSHA